jgi:hypothetical protein
VLLWGFAVASTRPKAYPIFTITPPKSATTRDQVISVRRLSQSKNAKIRQFSVDRIRSFPQALNDLFPIGSRAE